MINGLILDIVEAVKKDGTSYTDEQMITEYTDQIKTGDDKTLIEYLGTIKRFDLIDRINTYKEMNKI